MFSDTEHLYSTQEAKQLTSIPVPYSAKVVRTFQKLKDEINVWHIFTQKHLKKKSICLLADFGGFCFLPHLNISSSKL